MEAPPIDPTAPAQLEEYDIPNQPHLAPVATIEELQEHLQAHAREHGFAVIRRNAGNYRGEPRLPPRFKIACDRDTSRQPRGFGTRTTSTQKNNCP
ncbi:hypothetical protein BDP81DRAFT_443651 [Colletotrichum phormii]|uniref:Uncharacterized protein n=1 Tax=Colletotrichum phormii TaxID=359342 RepID=A0AAI9ZBV8_9PEZI|nr:uncharacterized protein BDP81DRAFT_443651 [Colletotrichum phormii]KAK1621427.1 hypothetical protein BDP81DRAFT_443651 [Colletotrichum phormii]